MNFKHIFLDERSQTQKSMCCKTIYVTFWERKNRKQISSWGERWTRKESMREFERGHVLNGIVMVDVGFYAFVKIHRSVGHRE